MEKILTISVKIRGTEDEIKKAKARFYALSACEEVISMYGTEVLLKG